MRALRRRRATIELPVPTARPSYGFAFRAMSSACELRLEGDDEAALAAAAQRAIDEVLRIEHKYSRYREDSIVSRINAAAGGADAVTVDAETAALLAFAGELHDASEGLFDITSGVLRRAWDFRAGRLPEPAALAALLPLIGWDKVEFGDARVRLPEAGMELDFGGFGKEYAADRAAAVLAAHGVQAALVNLGGDIRALGPRRDGQPWRLGIAHPRQPGAMLAELSLHTGALATSGDYERFIEVDGRRYCHVLHPHTGWPVEHWRSVSVVAPACLAAGTAATIAMLLGAQAPAFLQAEGLRFLPVDAEGRLQRSGG